MSHVPVHPPWMMSSQFRHHLYPKRPALQAVSLPGSNGSYAQHTPDTHSNLLYRSQAADHNTGPREPKDTAAAAVLWGAAVFSARTSAPGSPSQQTCADPDQRTLWAALTVPAFIPAATLQTTCSLLVVLCSSCFVVLFFIEVFCFCLVCV